MFKPIYLFKAFCGNYKTINDEKNHNSFIGLATKLTSPIFKL